MPNPHYHVIISGSGPAGCAAAIRLRQQGRKVALVDQVNDQKLKVGESLPGAAIRLLRSLGLQSLEELLPTSAFENCVANKSAWGTEQWSYTDALRNPEGGGWHIMRHTFEAALRQKAIDAGVHFYRGKSGSVRKVGKYTVRFKTPKPELPEAITANILIDATGRASAVLRQLGITRQHFQKQMAAVCWLHPKKEDVDKTTTIKSVSKGWWYTSQLPDGSRVLSFHGLPETVAKMVKDPKWYVQEFNKTQLINSQITTENILEGILARDASVSISKQAAGADWFAVGDAALSFDPLSSQGIFFALYSGLKAADAILKSSAGEANAINNYQQQVTEVFKANQRSRAYFYTIEKRFLEEDYWKQYQLVGGSASFR